MTDEPTPTADAVRVTTGGRLHFGFGNLSLAHERLYGACGVAVASRDSESPSNRPPPSRQSRQTEQATPHPRGSTRRRCVTTSPSRTCG
ncbi:MAG: hypothetical protein J07HB67_00071 [halophilic archaeon J07HB67]|nr:MAG: hypothetical protein J07HB67_00071 [halophilic archaeon J07HB67]